MADTGPINYSLPVAFVNHTHLELVFRQKVGQVKPANHIY